MRLEIGLISGIPYQWNPFFVLQIPSTSGVRTGASVQVVRALR